MGDQTVLDRGCALRAHRTPAVVAGLCLEVWSGNKAAGVAAEWAQQGQMAQGQRQGETKLLLD